MNCEPRRIELISSEPLNTLRKKKECSIAFRLQLELSDSTEHNYPEYSYTDLVKKSDVSFDLVIMLLL